ncbi:MAG: hypothetical protein WC710_13390 [Gallionella sp.]|jgi:hypothetical protein
MKIATNLTAEAAASFKSWIESVARNDVDANACLTECVEKIGANSDPAIYGHHYELGSFYTASKSPETYSFDVADLVFEDVE